MKNAWVIRPFQKEFCAVWFSRWSEFLIVERSCSKHWRLAGMIIFLSLTLILPCLAQETKKTFDPLQAAVTEYHNFSALVLSDGERLSKYREWKEILLSQIEECPESPACRPALYEVLYICNSIADEEGSFSVLDRLLNFSNLSEEETLRLKNEYAEVAHLKYLRTKNTKDGLLAIRNFDESNTIIETLLSKLKNAPETTNKFVQQENEKKLVRYTEQRILNNAWCGEITANLDDSKETSLKAARYFQCADDLLSEWGNPRGRMSGLNYDKEYFLSCEAKAYAKAGKIKKLKAVLESLNSLSDKRISTVVYIDSIIGESFIPRKESPVAFLEDWLLTHGDDIGTSRLVSTLPLAMIREKSQDYVNRVFPYLESLVDGKYAEELMQLDGDLFATGMGGRYADALTNIVNICIERKDYLNAQKYNERFLKMFSKYSGAIENAERLKSWLVVQSEIQEGSRNAFDQERQYSLWYRLMVPVLSLVLFLYVLYRRKKHLNSQ